MLNFKLLAIVVASGLLAIPGSIATQPVELKENDTRIIVELKADLDGLSEQGVINTQDAVIRNIKSIASSNVKLETRYSTIYNAVLLDVNSSDVELIKTLPGIKHVTIDKLHDVQTHDGAVRYTTIQKEGPATYSDSDNISAITMHKPDGTKEGEGIAIAILDNEFALKQKTNGDIDTRVTHEAFNKLPNGIKTKYTKSSIRAIIDGNKDFHGKPGARANQTTYFNNKVPFYYDYGGDVTSPSGQGVADWDTYSDTDTHGTHVATIAAGNGDTYKGIAPNAQIIAMKVFTMYEPTEAFKKLGAVGGSGAYDSAIFAAIEDCITLGVDAINMSLGSDLTDFDQDSPAVKAVKRLTEKGIIACIAAGNSGKTAYSFAGAYGNWTSDMVETGILGSYANVDSAMDVASGVPLATYYETAVTFNGFTVAYDDQVKNRDDDDTTFRPEDEKFIYDLTDGGTHCDFDFVKVPGFGEPKDYNDISVKGKIAVIDRGSISFEAKVKNAVSEGAIAVLFIDNDPTATEFLFRCSFGDSYVPPIPVANTLYRDRQSWITVDHGVLKIIKEEILDNMNPYTSSTFTSDGAKFNYDLKPDITTPGDGIKGGVSPHDKKKYDDPTKYPYLYEYLSGTSMATPNYCGVVALLLSEGVDKNELNMLAMSTADPMFTTNKHDEEVHTSPRIQGAGMVNLSKALDTKVYLEGLDLTNKDTGYAKICLYNSEDIAKGNLNLKFKVHNKSTVNQTYKAKTYLYCPDIAENNEIIQSPFKKIGTATTYVELVGSANVPEYFDVAQTVKNEDYCADPYGANYKKGVDKTQLNELDAYSVTTIPDNYYNYGWVEQGYKAFYLNAGNEWEEVPKMSYQSVTNHLVATYEENITVKPGDSLVELTKRSLTLEQKAEIDEFYTCGCALEGYVILESTGGEVSLSIPFLGFYGDYSKAPAVEPFGFEKEEGKIYASDLINDFAWNTAAKQNADFSSMWLVGYSETPGDIYTSNVENNDSNFHKLAEGVGAKWFEVGTDALSGQQIRDEDGNLKIFAGNAYNSNTMIIQQTVLRSIKSNTITLTDSSGKKVYSSYFTDLIGYSQESELYKSHIVGTGSYISHRAFAAIPLYDSRTKEAFPDGEYTIKFSYELLGVNDNPSTPETENVQELTYKIVIDNTAPEITTEETTGYIPVKNAQGEITGHKTGEVLRATIKEENLSYLVYNKTNIAMRTSDNPDEDGYYGIAYQGNGVYIYDIPASEAEKNCEKNKGRLSIEAYDQARGHNCYLLKDYEQGTSTKDLYKISGYNLDSGYNFEVQVNSNKNAMLVRIFTYDKKGNEVDVELDKPITLTFDLENILGVTNLEGYTIFDGNGESKEATTYVLEHYTDASGKARNLIHIQIKNGRLSFEKPAAPKNGCGGNIVATSAIVSILALAGIALLLIKNKKIKFGK